MQPNIPRPEAPKIKPTTQMLLVSIRKQRLTLIENGQRRETWDISTSLKPPSCQEGSHGTPTGLHQIAAKIGDAAPCGEVFKGRRSIGKRFWECDADEQARNLITSRILWLDGLEPGHNQGGDCDSRQRYIYIHGTNHEDKIGTPASGGCVQLRNLEMIELYDRVSEGTLVFIE